jgi:pimeloyl-ACP methyl ester carboxylesterase
MKPKQRSVVLVHGAFGGGFLWRSVAEALRSASFEVYTPTLTGLGERRHLFRAEVSLATHTRDIEAVFQYEDLDDVVLVGHSYGCMVIAGLSEEVAARVASVVLLDGPLPREGESMHTMFADLDESVVPKNLRSLQNRDTPEPGVLLMELPETLAKDHRMSPHPVSTHWASVSMHGVFDPPRRCTYVKCLQATFDAKSVVRARNDGWRIIEIDAPHDAHVADPSLVAHLISQIASDDAGAD